MNRLLDRIGIFIAYLLLYSTKVTTVSKPIYNDCIYISIKIGDVPKILKLSYNIVSMKEDEFFAYCIRYMKEEGLL